MRVFLIGICIATLSLWLGGQVGGSESEGRIIVNPAEAKWEASKAKSESTTLREDAKTGAIELFARYPAGHVFTPHWHDSNERIVLIEGRILMEEKDHKKFLEAGGYAYLPAHKVQRMTCVSDTRCSFYVYWDGPLDSHPVKD
jgi:quercetin dioxygenase-like cupin family protein